LQQATHSMKGKSILMI